MIQWEYKVFKFNGDAETPAEHEFLSAYGKEGWELCAIWSVLYYFKRPLKQQRQ